MAVRKTIALFTIALFVAVCATGALAWFVSSRMHEPYRGYSGAEQFIVIRQGAGTGEIGRRLAEGGVVSDGRLFRLAVLWTRQGRSLKAGEYRFDHPLTPLDVVGMLARGDVYVRRITFPEGLTIEEMAKLYESHGFGPADDFVRATKDVSQIRDLDPKATDLEGYLFPETYSLQRETSASQLVRAMIDRFRTVYRSAVPAGSDSGMTTRQVVTLASLVEKETGSPEERPIVSAVYRNRLKIGMPMQADPTIVYALEKARKYDGNIRREDLSLDSPYNTYKYPGLPPGPIASPGKASLEAASAPAAVPYLYFVSRNDGTHVFAKTLDEHERNVQKFQVDFFRAKRARR